MKYFNSDNENLIIIKKNIEVDDGVIGMMIGWVFVILYHIKEKWQHNGSTRKKRVKDIPKKFKDIVRVAFPWDNPTADTPTFTGIPVHVTTMEKLEEVQMKLEGLTNNFDTLLRAELDRRGMGDSDFCTNRIMNEIWTIQNELVSEIKSSQMNLI